MNGWKRCQKTDKRKQLRKIGGFTSKCYVKGGKVSKILQTLIPEKGLKCTKQQKLKVKFN